MVWRYLPVHRNIGHTVALLGVFCCWWAYQIYATPVRGVLSLPGFVVLLGSVLLLSTVAHVLEFHRVIQINRQVLALGVLHTLSLVSALWAESPAIVVSEMKFFLVLYVAFALLVTVLDTVRVQWMATLFFILILLASIAITFGLVLAFGGNGLVSALRDLGFDAQPNYYVLSVLVALPVLIHFFYHAKTLSGRAISVLLILASGLVILASGSRSPLIGIGLLLGGLTLVSHDRVAGWTGTRKTSLLALLAAGITGISVLLFFPGLMGRIVTQTSAEITYLLQGDYTEPGPLRSQIYLVALSELSDPETLLIGVGFGNFGQVFAEATGVAYYPNPHNVLLKYLVELGFAGFLLAVYVLIMPLRYGLTAIRDADSTERRSWYLAIFWSYVLLLGFSAFQPLMSHYEFYLLSAVLYGAYSNQPKTTPYNE